MPAARISCKFLLFVPFYATKRIKKCFCGIFGYPGALHLSLVFRPKPVVIPFRWVADDVFFYALTG
jgi:hypothetical protein